jgi:hypothetical protein
MPKTFTDQTATVTGTPLNSTNLTGMLSSADVGVASGVAGLDGSSHVIQLPATGIRQVKAQLMCTSQVNFLTNQATLAGFGSSFSITTTGGSLLFEGSAGFAHTVNDTGSFYLYVAWSGPASGSVQVLVFNNVALPYLGRTNFPFMQAATSLSAGTYTVNLGYISQGITCVTGDAYSNIFMRVSEYV